jgi:hypothetical protein
MADNDVNGVNGVNDVNGTNGTNGVNGVNGETHVSKLPSDFVWGFATAR